MRSRMIPFAAVMVVAFSASAYAQATLPKPAGAREEAMSSIDGTPYGNIDFGGQFSSITGDKARFQRYRDLRNGPLADNLLFNRRGQDWTLKASAVKMGYRDQRFTGEYRRVGKMKASFDWNQIPLFISADTRTLYTETSPGVFRLPDEMQAANQAGLTNIRNYSDNAVLFESRMRRDVGNFDFVYNANRDLDVKFNVTSAVRNGNMPYGAPFGFSNVVELSAPVDQRTTDAKASVEWANEKAFASVGWDGSWFYNNVETLIWDNPLKIADSPSYSSAYSDGKGPAQGRLAFWPDNTLQYVHGTASVSTPGRGRLTGYLAVGASKQNQPLLPHTINSLIPEIPLERATAETEIRNTMANLQYVVRPIPEFAINARYRYNDMDNRTPHFAVNGRVRFDGVYDGPTSAEPPPTPEPYTIKRQNLDIDGTFSALAYTSIKIGYSGALSDRTFRIWEKTNENTFRVSVDTTGNQYVTFRALYEDGRRRGDGFDVVLLEEVGEQPGMQHFDVADRDRKRFTLLATVMPMQTFGLNFSAGLGREEFPNSEFGLKNLDSNQYSAGFDFVPNDRVGLNVMYAWEDYTSVTGSRTANPLSATDFTFIDPRRNWFMDYDGKVKNFDMSFDVKELAPRTDMRLSVNWSDVKDGYIYRLTPDTVLPAPKQLPPVTNSLFRGTADLAYKLTTHLKAGGSYWYEDYNTEDFALGSQIISDIALPTIQPGATPVAPTTLLLRYMYRPYTAHTGMLRLTYLW